MVLLHPSSSNRDTTTTTRQLALPWKHDEDGLHPRNPFAGNPPNFDDLATDFPELKPFLIHYLDSNDIQKVTIDFHNPLAVQTLTRAIFKCHFQLNVTFPLHSLCPMITNRLNYLLEVEDLLHRIDYTGQVTILDIGTGYSCVFPLLGCRLNKDWNFIATELDPAAMAHAAHLVAHNHLSARVRVVPSTPAYIPAMDTLTLTMCNPPFYTDPAHQARLRASKHTVHPHTPCTPTEAFTDGGEVRFVHAIMQRSRCLLSRVAWYTAMVGLKASVKVLEDALKQMEPPPTMLVTRPLRQGQTSRTLLAWSWFPRRCQHRYLTTAWAAPAPLFDHLAATLAPHATAFVRVAATCVRFQLHTLFWTRAYRRHQHQRQHSNNGGAGVATAPHVVLRIRVWTDQGGEGGGRLRVWVSGPDREPGFESFRMYFKKTFLDGGQGGVRGLTGNEGDTCEMESE